MGMNLSGRTRQPISEINVTPFVDVMLVLLVIFMVTAPMMVQGIEVALPEAKGQEVSKIEEKITVNIRRNKSIYLGEVKVSLGQLKEKLSANDKLKRNKEVLLHADKNLPYGLIVEVMSVLKEAGAESIGMITDQANEVETEK
jgi:biopolymer transport protein TolR